MSQNCITTSYNQSKLHSNKSQQVKIVFQQVIMSQNCITTSHNESKLHSNKSQPVKTAFQQVTTSQNCILTSHNFSKTSDNESKTSTTCQNNNNKSKLQIYKCRMIFLKSGRCILILMGEGVVKWSRGGIIKGSSQNMLKQGWVKANVVRRGRGL